MLAWELQQKAVNIVGLWLRFLQKCSYKYKLNYLQTDTHGFFKPGRFIMEFSNFIFNKK